MVNFPFRNIVIQEENPAKYKNCSGDILNSLNCFLGCGGWVLCRKPSRLGFLGALAKPRDYISSFSRN